LEKLGVPYQTREPSHRVVALNPSAAESDYNQEEDLDRGRAMTSITLAPPLASTGDPADPDERLAAGRAGATGGYHAPVTERDQPEAERPGVPRVLVVDDAPAIRSALRGLLEDAGIQVVGEAPDGAEGVVLTASLRPDVVLMDLRMPSADGFQATERIVEAFPDVRVVVLSAYESKESVEAAQAAGAFAFLPKYCPAEQIRETVLAAWRWNGQDTPGR
jgi:CheY-like chemotaxis protein